MAGRSPGMRGFFNLIQHRWVADLMRFEEREPYGFIDKRLRTVIMQAIQSGNGGEFGLSSYSRCAVV